tara:strand:- start:4403 stop:4783 length:381 start_codon:yes stop_codon:yes gene_type:complete
MSCATTEIKKETVSLNDDVVVLYSTSWCSWCDKAKEFLKDNEIHYIEKDFENDNDYEQLVKYAKSIGYKGRLSAVPLFIVKGKIIVGFQPLEIIYILEKKAGVIRTFSREEKAENFKGSEIFTNED